MDMIKIPKIGTAAAQAERPGWAPSAQPVEPSVSIPPKVTAIMVIADVRRFRLAVHAIEQFSQQTYQHKEMVIVNSSGTRLTGPDTDVGREIGVSAAECPTVAALRNRGIQEATGEWCLFFDDDDYQHPHRMTFQMAHRRPGYCVVLRDQLRVDVRNSTACVWSEPNGIPGSVLFPKRPSWMQGKEPQFDASLIENEDGAFLSNFGKRRILLANDNRWFPGPALMVAFWHGLNVKTREAFFGKYAAEQYQRVRLPEITDDLSEYLKAVLEVYNMSVHEEVVPRASV